MAAAPATEFQSTDPPTCDDVGNLKTTESQTTGSIEDKKEKTGDEKEKEKKEEDIILDTTVHGVYFLTREVRLRSKKFNTSIHLSLDGLSTRLKRRISLFSYGYRFFMECFHKSPLLMTLYLMMKMWESLRSALTMFLTDRLMKTIQNGITTHSIDGTALAEILILRLLAIALESFVSSKSDELGAILHPKIGYLALGRMVQVNLSFDVPTYQNSKYIERSERYLRPYRHSENIWDQFERLVKVGSDVTMMFSQISFLYYLLRAQPGGLWFIFVSAIGPLSEGTLISGPQLSAYVWISNPFFHRIRTTITLLYNESYRLEMVSLGMKRYMLREWNTAVKGLGDTSEVIPSIQEFPKGDFKAIFRRDLISHLPLMFYSYQVYLNPKAFSLSSIALMQQATTMIGEILESLFGRSNPDPIDFEWMKSLYEGSPEPNVIQDGETTYPRTDIDSSNGMEVKFENVSFTYPKGKEPVLKDVSFAIKPGQTVVIVGMNGSGKSTLLKLINRIYDVSSGIAYLDSQPLKSYISASVQDAMAILFQEFNHLPVSLAENIFLGCSDPPEGVESFDPDLQDINHEKTREAIHRAAELGGSLEIINKQKKGLDAVLDPLYPVDFQNYDTASTKLKEFMEETSRYVSLSSGQWQRLALARLFYRAAMKHVKLVAADEPSASLDPEIEYQIFSRLYDLSAKQGKTLVYVTHRFGYLTKRADLILVMKDGRLVEQGRHADLLALNAEYAKLYKVQAEAFFSDEELKESIPNTPETSARSIDSSSSEAS